MNYALTRSNRGNFLREIVVVARIFFFANSLKIPTILFNFTTFLNKRGWSLLGKIDSNTLIEGLKDSKNTVGNLKIQN
jgi:hypothetical protein